MNGYIPYPGNTDNTLTLILVGGGVAASYVQFRRHRDSVPRPSNGNTTVKQRPPADRWIAAVAHLGIPLYSVFCPLVVWTISASHPFRREHARQAFSMQVTFLAVWVVLVVLMAFNVLATSVLLTVLAVGFVAELPQVARALAGRPPLRLIPFELLAE